MDKSFQFSKIDFCKFNHILIHLLIGRIHQLPQAILGKAIRGELVGQEVKEYAVEESEGLMAAEEQLSYQLKTKT